MPQESDYLMRAIESYQRALGLYTQASTLVTSPTNIRLTDRALVQAQRRLETLSFFGAEPATPEPPPSDSAAPPLPESLSRGTSRLEEAPWP
jgi:hypothetical protein